MKELNFNTSEQKVFFCSDLHFSHKNIIKFCKRPWETPEEMNKALIENWNNTVSKDDIVFCLGDFAYSHWKQILQQLNGTIYLILGNHDISRYPGDNVMKLFAGVYHQLRITVNGRKLYLNHFPLLCFDGVYRPKKEMIWQLFGHVHTLKEGNTGKDFERLNYLLPMQYDVGIDFNDYKPISFEEVSEKINYQIENNVNITHWIK
jgi:calcineurin-like phosphoesterase family protein